MLGVTLPAELMAAGGVDRLPGLFEFTDFHQTNTHLYIFGYTSVGERGTFLRVSRAQTSTSLEIECDEREHTVESYEKELRKIHESSHSNGGLQPVCKVCAEVSDHAGVLVCSAAAQFPVDHAHYSSFCAFVCWETLAS